MLYRNFSQFEILKPARLVKVGEAPETPPAVVPESQKPDEAPKKPSPLPAEQAKKSQEVRQQGNEAQAEDAAGADKQLDEQTAAAEKAKQEEAEKIVADMSAKYPQAFDKFQKDTSEKAGKAFIDSVEDVDKQKLTDALKIVFPTETEKKEEDSDKTSDVLKGAGSGTLLERLGALLEKLMDRLTKLSDTFSSELKKLFGSFEKKTAKKILSPLGSNKKITIAKDYEAGKGIVIAADANAEIYSVGGGTVTNIDRNTNTIEIIGPDGKSKIVYKNVIPDSNLKTGDEATKIEPGKHFLLGKAATNSGISFQFFDSNGTEQDPTENFKKAELIEEKTKEEEPAKGQTSLAKKDVSKKPADEKPKT